MRRMAAPVPEVDSLFTAPDHAPSVQREMDANRSRVHRSQPVEVLRRTGGGVGAGRPEGVLGQTAAPLEPEVFAAAAGGCTQPALRPGASRVPGSRPRERLDEDGTVLNSTLGTKPWGVPSGEPGGAELVPGTAAAGELADASAKPLANLLGPCPEAPPVVLGSGATHLLHCFHPGPDHGLWERVVGAATEITTVVPHPATWQFECLDFEDTGNHAELVCSIRRAPASRGGGHFHLLIQRQSWAGHSLALLRNFVEKMVEKLSDVMEEQQVFSDDQVAAADPSIAAVFRSAAPTPMATAAFSGTVPPAPAAAHTMAAKTDSDGFVGAEPLSAAVFSSLVSASEASKRGAEEESHLGGWRAAAADMVWETPADAPDQDASQSDAPFDVLLGMLQGGSEKMVFEAASALLNPGASGALTPNEAAGVSAAASSAVQRFVQEHNGATSAEIAPILAQLLLLQLRAADAIAGAGERLQASLSGGFLAVLAKLQQGTGLRDLGIWEPTIARIAALVAQRYRGGAP